MGRIYLVDRGSIDDAWIKIVFDGGGLINEIEINCGVIWFLMLFSYIRNIKK